MNALRLKSYAKINLFLRVCGKRDDGYHRLQTFFHTIDLHDELEFEVSGGGESSLDCVEGGAPPFAENLIGKAWQLLAGEFSGRVLPVAVRLRKRIPSGAGFGGGSSNAAAALHGLNRLFGLGLSAAELEQRAARLGADVAFFVRGGAQIGVGRGEELHPLQPLSEGELLLVQPACTISTKAAYAQFGNEFRPALTARELAAKALALRRGKFTAVLENSFEPALAGSNDAELRANYALIRQARERLLELGCRCAMMTGSGSAVFGIAPSVEIVPETVRKLAREYPFATSARFMTPDLIEY